MSNTDSDPEPIPPLKFTNLVENLDDRDNVEVQLIRARIDLERQEELIRINLLKSKRYLLADPETKKTYE